MVVITDASAQERNLYLAAELLHLPARLVVALNMMDVAEQEGLWQGLPAALSGFRLQHRWRSRTVSGLL